MAAQIITLLAEKGGVGRTTLTINLAGAFARDGHRVLLVDMEGQASLSKFFFGPQVVEQFPIHKTMASVFDEGSAPDPKLIVQPTTCERISVAPSSRLLADYDFPRPFTLGPLPFALRDFLAEVVTDFDIILCDTPPKIQGLLGVAAVVASHAVITPVQPEPFAVQAVVEVHRLIYEVQQVSNPTLQHLGFVVTLKRRQALHNATEKMLRNNYQSQVFETVIQSAAAYAEANALRCPITEYVPKTKTGQVAAANAATEVRQLAAEVQVRLSGQAPQTKTKAKTRRVA